MEKEENRKKAKRKEAMKEYLEKKRKNKGKEMKEEVEKLGIGEFDFEQYVDAMGIDCNLQSVLLEQQEDEHFKLVEFQKEMKKQE